MKVNVGKEYWKGGKMEPIRYFGSNYPNESCKNCKHKTRIDQNGIKWGCSKKDEPLKTLKGYCFSHKWNGDVK